MNKLTKRDWWAFCIGLSVTGLTLGLVCGAPTVFLFNAVLLGLDVYFFMGTLQKEEDDGQNN